jgi:hypothetical protein
MIRSLVVALTIEFRLGSRARDTVDALRPRSAATSARVARFRYLVGVPPGLSVA